MSAKGLWQKEDNLAILIAFVLIFVVNLGHFAGLDFISFLNFKITTYSNFNELLAGLNLLNFILFYMLFAGVFAFVAWIYGRGLRKFIFEFSAFFILCVLVLVFCAYAGFKNLKNWFFTLAFLSIGFSVRFKDILSVGFKPFLAFFFGALINLIVGFVLCVFVFDEFWSDFLKG